MKIEKGKLYYHIEIGKVVKSESDGFIKWENEVRKVEDVSFFSDKIAVHCPTKEDWEYVVSKGYELCGYSNEFNYKYYSLSYNTYGSLTCFEIERFFTISFDQFKEFYPYISKDGLIGNINPSHYSTLSIQPIDYIEANKLDFNEGNVIKYVSRYKQKNGLEDLKKARFYIDRLIEINSK